MTHTLHNESTVDLSLVRNNGRVVLGTEIL